jgi:GLPGLI family protein
MKNLLFALMALISFSLFAQDDFEGTIKYEMTYSNIPAEMQQFSAMLPTQTTMYVKGDKSRVETSIPMGSQALIFNKNATEFIMLMDMMGMRKAVKVAIDNSQENIPQITYHDEYKTVAGYKCQKASVVTSDENGNSVTLELYFTEEIPNAHKDLNFVKGLPLQYNAKQNGIDVNFIATSIDKTPVSDNNFVIPEGYELTTMEALQGGY